MNFVAPLIAFLTAVPASAGFPLTCAFDGAQAINVKIVPPGNELQVSFGFRGAARPASEGVEPGTCAWADRAFRQGEPTVFLKKIGGTSGLMYVPSEGLMQLVPGMELWIPKAAKRGYQISFKVSAAPAGTGFGIAAPVMLAE